jgi:hypothetical protein
MTLKKLKEGLEIFLKWSKKEDITLGGAEHDVVDVILDSDLKKMPIEDYERLGKLGFTRDEDNKAWRFYT